MMADRSSAVVERVAAEELDALIITDPANIRYVTGFTGSNGTVLVRGSEISLITDSRYSAWAEREISEHDASVSVIIAPGAGRAQLRELVDGAGAVGLEASHVSWSTADSYRSDFGEQTVRATVGLIEGLRELKSDSEVDSIRSAAAVTDRALAILIKELVPGHSEKDVARRLEQLMYDDAGVEPSFDIIVAGGPNAAKAHHQPGNRVLERGDLVIIDSGSTVDGYRSDMTRSFVLGQPTPQQQDMLDAVLVAQQAGVDAVGPGVGAADIDAACRESLVEAGLAEFFTHGTGHGVGLEIHEAPGVNSRATATLTPGHVITVEPGVYIPDVGGVRWEDTVVVTPTGAEVLTRSPKQPVIEL